MSLELMIGIDNNGKPGLGIQVGIRNNSSYHKYVLQLGLFNKTPKRKDLNGLQMGFVSYASYMCGLQVNGLVSLSDEIKGVQISALANLSDAYGLQISPLNVGNLLGGAMAGVVNLAIGERQPSYGVELGLLANISLGDYVGMKIAPINVSISGLSDDDFKCKSVDVGVVNVALGDFNGLQVGFICYAPEKGNYTQIGFLTIRGGDGPWYKRISPLVGFHRD